MPAYVPHSQGFMDSRLIEIDRRLRDGDATKGWPGDPRLYLSVGNIIDKRTGTVVEQRVEVWRHSEDGRDYYIASWGKHEVELIIGDMARMRLDSPGHQNTSDLIDQANAAMEKKVMDEYKDSYGAMVEHLCSIIVDSTQPKNTFRQVGGLRDRITEPPKPKAKPDAQV